jgi:chromate reductase
MAINIVTICGSTRKASFNRALMNVLPSLAPAGMTFKESTRIDTIPHYNADVNANGFPDEVQKFADSLRSADGIIIVSPEYNWTIPGTLKNALDWVSRMKDQPFANKPVAIQSATGGPLGGARMQYHLRMTLTYLNSFTFGTPEVFVGMAQNKFDEKTLELKDEATKKVIASQLEGFAAFIQRVKA